MHPGTSNCDVELMIEMQLKGLGAGETNNAGRLQPVANYVMGKWRMAHSYGHRRTKNRHMPYYATAFLNLLKALAREEPGRRSVEL